MSEEQIKAEQPTKLTPTKRNIPSIYANNFFFEPSVWDLGILLGKLDKAEGGDALIDWRVSTTIPWAVAKNLCFYLQMNILNHEQNYGFIEVPTAQIPKRPLPPTEDAPEADKAIYERASRIHAELFSRKP